MVFFLSDAEGVIHRQFVPEGQKVNAEFYVGVFDRLMKRIRRIRTAEFQSNEWFLLHDNAPYHNAVTVKKFPANRNVAFDVYADRAASQYNLSQYLTKFDAQNLFHNKFYFMPLHVSSKYA